MQEEVIINVPCLALSDRVDLLQSVLRVFEKILF